MSLDININYNELENIWLIDIAGEIDIYTAKDLKEMLNKKLDEHTESMKMDCAALEYIDSTGLGVLISILKRLKQNNKDIIIANPRPNILKLLTITGLNKIFLIEGE
jgi:anti-sigma B factor antagonist